MSITTDSVLTKMIRELESARLNKNRTEVVREHVRAVRSLCDLILDDYQQEKIDDAQEIRKMMGDLNQQKQGGKESSSENGQRLPTLQTKVEEDDANGDSIFDF